MNATDEFTADHLAEAFQIATAQALEDYGPVDPDARDMYVATYTVRVDGVLTDIDVEVDRGHYWVRQYEYSDLERVITDDSRIPEFVEENGSDLASSVAGYLADEPDLLVVIRHELARRDDVKLHSPAGADGEYVLSFPYDSGRAAVSLVEQLAIAHAMAAANFHVAVPEEVAEAILEGLYEDATYDELLEAAIAQISAGAERAEAFLWEIGEVTPWARGVRLAAVRRGYRLRMGEVFDAIDR